MRTGIEHQRQLAAAIDTAWQLLPDYPARLTDFLAAALLRGREEGRAGEAFRLGKLCTRGGMRHQLPGVERALTLVRGPKVTDTISKRGAFAPVKKAAHELGALTGQISEARDRGYLKTSLCLRHQLLVQVFDETEIRELRVLQDDIVSTRVIEGELGLCAYAIEQLLDAGELQSQTHPWLAHRYGGARCTSEDLRAFAEDLRLSALPDPAPDGRPPQGWTELATVMRGYGGGPKPWAAVVRHLKAGTVPFRCKSLSIRPLDIIVSVEDAARIRALPPGHAKAFYSQREAKELLNLHHEHADALKPLRRPLAGARGWRLDGGEILELARARVTLSELEARTGRRSRNLLLSLAEHGLERVDAFGWDRNRVEDISDLRC